MRVRVDFLDEARDRAVVTIAPSLIGRLLRRLPRVAAIRYASLFPGDTGWRYEVDDAHVEARLVKIVNDRRRWDEEPSHFVSGARLLNRKKR